MDWLRDRRLVIAIGGAAGIFVVGVLLLFTTGEGSESSAGVTIEPGQPAEATPASPQELREATEVPVIEELDEFRKTYGDPPDSQLGRLRIPKIGVDAPLGSRLVPADGQMPLPSEPSDVVWYDFSAWPGYGWASRLKNMGRCLTERIPGYEIAAATVTVEQELPPPGGEYYQPSRPVGELYPCWRHIEVGETAYLHGSALFCDQCHPFVPSDESGETVLDHAAICGGGHTED